MVPQIWFKGTLISWGAQVSENFYPEREIISPKTNISQNHLKNKFHEVLS